MTSPTSCPGIAIVIPTLRRPEPLRRALASVQAQRLDAVLEILVVDNSPDAGARAQVADIAASTRVPVRYVSEPDPGVATARNRGVRETDADWIAFLDDDEEASAGWLAQMLAVATTSGADAVFGPVEAVAEGEGAIGPFSRYFERSFDLPDGADLTAMSAYLGTNNSMFRRAVCLAEAAPFDENLNRCGGEDSLLIRRLRMAGRRFAWASGATVREWVPERRRSWRYVWRRKFLSGQVRSFVPRMIDPPRWPEIALWMAAGGAQLAGAGAAAAVMAPFDRERAAHLAATACGGAGKILWMRRFRPGLYGAGLVS